MYFFFNDTATTEIYTLSLHDALPISTPPNDYLVSTNCSTTIREDVMKYLCLIYDEEKKVGSMSKSESDAFMGEYYAFTEGIQKSGHYVAGEALQPIHTATTVRIRNGKLSTTDG